MIKKIALTTVATLLLFTGCGDEKSTGEKMAESVAKIRGDAPTTDSSIDTPIKKISSEKTVQEKSEKEVVKEEVAAEEPTLSLKNIALKATQEIKEITKPAAEIMDDMKDAASIATMILTTEAVVSELPKKEEAHGHDHSAMGMPAMM